MKTIIALYDRLEVAEAALRELQAQGVSRDRISLVASVADQDMRPYFDERGRYRRDRHRTDKASNEAGAGLSIGSLLAGLTFLSIPGIGPLLAAGPLAGAVAGAGAGAAGAGLGAILIEAGVPEQEAMLYQEAVLRDGVLLLVTGSQDEVDRVVATLERHAPLDLERQRLTWEHEREEHRARHASAP